MTSSNGPPSFSSIGINGYDYFGSCDTDTCNKPPSYGSLGHPQGNSYNQFHDGNLNRGLTHIDLVVDDTKAPSFTNLGPVQVNSYNQDGNTYTNREVSSDQNPLSIGAMARGSVSQPSGGVDPYSDEKGPNLSDVNRRESSQNGVLMDVVFEGPNAHEFVGISLVGKNFKRFYPNAYYKEKDSEN